MYIYACTQSCSAFSADHVGGEGVVINALAQYFFTMLAMLQKNLCSRHRLPFMTPPPPAQITAGPHCIPKKKDRDRKEGKGGRS